jgi:hypothetical protein
MNLAALTQTTVELDGDSPVEVAPPKRDYSVQVWRVSGNWSDGDPLVLESWDGNTATALDPNIDLVGAPNADLPGINLYTEKHSGLSVSAGESSEGTVTVWWRYYASSLTSRTPE